MQARYCAPNPGRFVSLAPLRGLARDPLTLHHYLYVGNNPASYVDPSGEPVQVIPIVLVIAIIAYLAFALLPPVAERKFGERCPTWPGETKWEKHPEWH